MFGLGKKKNDRKKEDRKGLRWLYVACFIGVVWASEAGAPVGSDGGYILMVLAIGAALKWIGGHLWGQARSINDIDEYWRDK